MYTSHIFIDLEMNPISREFPEEKEACRAEIIEIGAVRLDADYNLTDRFTLFVRPRYSTELNRHVAKLTGIKLTDLQDAPDFREAIEIFTDWVGTGNIRFYSWSMSDWWQLADEGELKLGELPDIYYESRWVDFQAVFTRLVGLSRANPLSLKNAIIAVEEQFDGAEHRAVNDAENSARLLQIVKSGQFPEKSRKIRAFFGQKDKEQPKIAAFADLLKSMN